jgi:hypothetical protein
LAFNVRPPRHPGCPQPASSVVVLSPVSGVVDQTEHLGFRVQPTSSGAGSPVSPVLLHEPASPPPVPYLRRSSSVVMGLGDVSVLPPPVPEEVTRHRRALNGYRDLPACMQNDVHWALWVYLGMPETLGADTGRECALKVVFGRCSPLEKEKFHKAYSFITQGTSDFFHNVEKRVNNAIFSRIRKPRLCERYFLTLLTAHSVLKEQSKQKTTEEKAIEAQLTRNHLLNRLLPYCSEAFQQALIEQGVVSALDKFRDLSIELTEAQLHARARVYTFWATRPHASATPSL